MEIRRETHIQESACQNTLHSNPQISISTNDRTILPSQFHKTRLEILPASTRNLPSDGCTPREIDLAHGLVLNHGVDNLGSILRCAMDDIQAAGW
jgi:hypothetical protein